MRSVDGMGCTSTPRLWSATICGQAAPAPRPAALSPASGPATLQLLSSAIMHLSNPAQLAQPSSTCCLQQPKHNEPRAAQLGPARRSAASPRPHLHRVRVNVLNLHRQHVHTLRKGLDRLGVAEAAHHLAGGHGTSGR